MESTFAANNFVEFGRRAREALALELPYADRPPLFTSAPAPSAVLLVFAMSEQGLALLITRRTDSVLKHTGQMAFPGGRGEPGELGLETALRETEEEVGIHRRDLEILGELPCIDVPTGFVIQPYVALHRKSLSEIQLLVSESEIAETLWAPWLVLQSPETYKKEAVSRGGFNFTTPVFYVGGHRVWGATAAMIKNLLDRLQRVG